MTAACIAAGKRSKDPKIRKKANFAANVRKRKGAKRKKRTKRKRR